MFPDRIRTLSAIALSFLITVSANVSVLAAAATVSKPKTPQEFAALYMASFNKKDRAALKSLRLQATAPSEMQKMIDEISEAELMSGTQYNKFEIMPVPPGMDKPELGLDGKFYQPSLKPTHMVKFTAQTKDGTSSTTMPIGMKNGFYYLATLEHAAGAEPPYQFGWQRVTMPQTTWSVMMPNEPEPGRAALEVRDGKDALKSADAYGVVKNTASIKTAQHWFYCGEEGKRVNAPENKETFRAACTTYEPDTLKEWFSDVKKNLDQAAEYRVRTEGKLIQQKEVELNGAPGREFEIKGKDGTTILGRVYWIKDALYELTFESKKDTPDVASASKFLGSLEVQ